MYLREIEVDDLEALYDIYSEKGMTDYIEPLYEDKSEEEKFTRAYIDNMYRFYGYGIWLVCLKENDKIIGRAGLSNREVDGENKLEIGYLIGKQYWRQGYAFEICNAICDYARDELFAEELVAFMDRKNVASIRLAEKLKFIFMGYVSEDEMVYYKRIL